MVAELSQQNKAERRRFFRIKDEIVLFYNLLDSDQVPEPAGFKQEVVDSFSLTTALAHLTEDTRAQQKILDKSYPEIASYLKVLEHKINLIAQTVLINDASLSNQPAREVDLSASGVAFASEKEIASGSVLELKMVLPPSLVAVVTFGKVVHCEKNKENQNFAFPFNVGVDFLELKDQDRELLIRHIVKKQMLDIRKKNEPC